MAELLHGVQRKVQTNMERFILVLLVLFWYSPVRALPDGPPMSACGDMLPGTQVGETAREGHVKPPQNTKPGKRPESPVYIQIHTPNATYVPGEKLKVSIIANQTLGPNIYKGVLMQARGVICASNNTVKVEPIPLGEFELLPSPTDSLLKTMDCGGREKSAVSHKSPQYKINQTVGWMVPNGYGGGIVFRATIVQEANTYWTEVHSKILLRNIDVKPPPCAAPPSLSLYLPLLLLVAAISMLQKEL